jgi:hypothetical protein
MYFEQLGRNGFLLAMCVLEVFTIAISVSLGVTITKRISSISRALADVARTVLIWTFGFIVTKLTSYGRLCNDFDWYHCLPYENKPSSN